MYTDISLVGEPELEAFFLKFGGVVRRNVNGTYEVWPSVALGSASDIIPRSRNGAFVVPAQECISHLQVAAAAVYYAFSQVNSIKRSNSDL